MIDISFITKKNVSKTTLGLSTLIFISLSLVIWFYSGGAETSYVIKPSPSQIRYIDDAPMGGNTQGEISQDANGNIRLSCELGDAYIWPFCEVAISLGEAVDKGLDLSNYHSLKIAYEYDIPDQNQRLRVYLRNFDPAYSTIEDPVSLKFNGVEFGTHSGGAEEVLPFNAFQVLSWWIADKKVSLEHSGPDLSNVSIIEIATSSAPILGKHDLLFTDLRFEGVVLTERQLFMVLTIMWVCTAMGALIVRYIQNYRVYEKEKHRSERLSSINHALKQQSETLSIMAKTDALTGLRNRQGINRDLESLLKTYDYKNCTLLFIDIDHFKKVNDTYGHDMGDEILIQTANILKDGAHSKDMVIRWGGEEFLIFSPIKNIAQATFLAEKIRKTFESQVWSHEQPLTCSIGVASLSDSSLAMMIANADDALLRAKKSGRNCVEIFTENMLVI